MAEEEPSVNIGQAIGAKLTESIKNMDVISIVQKMVATAPEDDESEEARDKLRGVLEKYNSMSDHEREQFTTKMKEVLAEKLSMRLGESGGLNLDGLQQAIGEAIMYRLIFIGVGCVLLVILVVFFGYKLYKSIKEKEKKREEKKKAKMMKKKK